MTVLVNVLLILLIVVFLVLGIIGLVSPIFPGLPLLFAAVWVLAHMTDYQAIGSTGLIVYGVVMAAGVALDYIAGLMGAKYTGASKKALWGALIGGIAGVFFGFVGILFFPVVGAMIGELMDYSNMSKASKVGVGTFMGFIVGTFLKFIFALIIVGGASVQYIIYLFSS